MMLSRVCSYSYTVEELEESSMLWYLISVQLGKGVLESHAILLAGLAL